MEWIQVATIVGMNIALFGALATIIVWVVNKLDTDVKDIGTRMDKFEARMDGHASRIDQLYRMFVDLQGQMKDEIVEIKKDMYMSMKGK